MFKTSMAISPTPTKFGPLLFASEWSRAIQTAEELGYDGIEISLREPDTELLDKLSKAVQRAGLAISAVATGQSYLHDDLSLTNLDSAAQEKLKDRMCGFINFAAPWQALVILGGVRGTLATEHSIQLEQFQAATESVRSFAEYAEAFGVRLAIEPINRYETNFLNTVEQALQFIDDVGADNLVVLPDTFHMNIEEASMSKPLARAGQKVGYVHFADSNRLAPGEGHINFVEIARELEKTNYAGYISAEILPIPDSRTAAELAIEHFRWLQSQL